MNKFKKGDTLVVLQSSEKANIGLVGTVTDITDGDNYTLDILPNYAFKEVCLKKAEGADLIREERKRQIQEEGYDATFDRHHTPQVLARAAVSYALQNDGSKLIVDAGTQLWPWSPNVFKAKDQKRNLVRAGALIAAAIDRLLADEQE